MPKAPKKRTVSKGKQPATSTPTPRRSGRSRSVQIEINSGETSPSGTASAEPSSLPTTPPAGPSQVPIPYGTTIPAIQTLGTSIFPWIEANL